METVLNTSGSRPPIGALVVHSTEDYTIPGIFMGTLPDGRIRLLVIETMCHSSNPHAFESEFGEHRFERVARSEVALRFVPDGDLELLSETSSLQGLLITAIRRGNRTEIEFLHNLVSQAMNEDGDPSVFLVELIVAANEAQSEEQNWRYCVDDSAIGDFMLYAAAITDAAAALTIARDATLPLPIRLSCLQHVDDPALIASFVDAFVGIQYDDDRREVLEHSASFLIPWLVRLEQVTELSRIARFYTRSEFECIFGELDATSQMVLRAFRVTPG